MRILVIGASGFIGQHLVRRLGDTPGDLVAGTFLSRAPADDGNNWYPVELTDATGLERVFQRTQPDVVVHLAAMRTWEGRNGNLRGLRASMLPQR